MVGCQLPEQDCASIDEISNIPIEIVTLKSHKRHFEVTLQSQETGLEL